MLSPRDQDEEPQQGHLPGLHLHAGSAYATPFGKDAFRRTMSLLYRAALIKVKSSVSRPAWVRSAPVSGSNSRSEGFPGCADIVAKVQNRWELIFLLLKNSTDDR